MNLNDNQKKIYAKIDKEVNLNDAKLSDEYYYDSLPQCLIDATFSIGTRYVSTRNTVIRACEKLEIVRLDPTTHFQSDNYRIDQFIKDIGNHENWGMIDIYNNRQLTSPRGGITKAEAVYKLAQKLQKHNINTLKDLRSCTDLETLEKDYKSIEGQESGVSFSYFLMLSGDDNHIKADRWILRFLEETTGKEYNKEEAEEDLRAVCNELQNVYPTLTLRLLDHMIWNHMRGKEIATNFTAKSRIANYPKHSSKAEYIKSFNNNTTLDADTKYLIVGTLTPPDGRNPQNHNYGYFYCSDINKMYEFIDNALGTNLVELKNKYRDGWGKEAKEDIKRVLINKKIAFLDVVQEGYIIKDSSKDEDIECYQVDLDEFAKIKKYNDVKIVANSKNAKIVLKRLLKQLGIKKEIKLIPQQLRGNWERYPCMEKLQEAWKDWLNS